MIHLDDPNAAVATKARWALAQLRDARLIPRLIGELGETDHGERPMITQLLAGYGTVAIAPLSRALTQGEPSERAHAAEVLLAIGSPEADAAVPALGGAVDTAAEIDGKAQQCAVLSGSADDETTESAVSSLMTLASTQSGEARAVLERATCFRRVGWPAWPGICSLTC